MKVALVHMRHATTGGAERYLSHLARFLAERGHDVTWVCRSHEPTPPHPDVRFHVSHDFALGAAWRMWAFAKGVERHVAEAGYDVVFGLGRTWNQDVVRLADGCTQTYLDRAHAATLTPVETLFRKGRMKHRVGARIEARALSPSAFRRVIVNSNMVKRDAMQRYRIPESAIEVIHNGVDLEHFHPKHREEAGHTLRREAGFGDDELVVLFLGTGYGRKGLDLLIEAFPRVVETCPRARLMVVGYDSSRPHYEERARKLGLSGVARFLGGRRDPEVCYGAGDLFCLPTRYDPFANATVEALASGLPVITSDANGGSELIGADEGAVVSLADGPQALADAILSWSDPDRLRAGSLAARELAEKHDIDSKLEPTLRLIEACAS